MVAAELHKWVFSHPDKIRYTLQIKSVNIMAESPEPAIVPETLGVTSSSSANLLAGFLKQQKVRE